MEGPTNTFFLFVYFESRFSLAFLHDEVGGTHSSIQLLLYLDPIHLFRDGVRK